MANNPLFVIQRENAGRLAQQKFEFQHHWGLSKVLEYYREGINFILCVEVHEDVIIGLAEKTDEYMELTEDNTFFDFYQVKSFANKLTLNGIIKCSKSSNSILGKMILGVKGKPFDSKVKSIKLVSSSDFSGIYPRNKPLVNEFKFSDVTQKAQEEIENSLKNELNSNDLTSFLNRIAFVKTDLTDAMYREILLGQIGKILDDKFPNTFFRASDIYSALIDELKRKSEVKYDYPLWDEFCSNKALTYSDIEKLRLRSAKEDSLRKESAILEHLPIAGLLKIKLRTAFEKYHGYFTYDRKPWANQVKEEIQLVIKKRGVDDYCDEFEFFQGFLPDISEEIRAHLANEDNLLIAAIIYELEDMVQNGQIQI